MPRYVHSDCDFHEHADSVESQEGQLDEYARWRIERFVILPYRFMVWFLSAFSQLAKACPTGHVRSSLETVAHEI
jgi:hypothetical protein